ncbi:MAG: hypothetical protein LBR68_03210, partial [Lachnoclostridium sp.]|nr:hypothetical protein [Lachnoclostridium sp.]
PVTYLKSAEAEQPVMRKLIGKSDLIFPQKKRGSYGNTEDTFPGNQGTEILYNQAIHSASRLYHNAGQFKSGFSEYKNIAGCSVFNSGNDSFGGFPFRVDHNSLEGQLDRNIIIE